jgi:hypothetical protein
MRNPLSCSNPPFQKMFTDGVVVDITCYRKNPSLILGSSDHVTCFIHAQHFPRSIAHCYLHQCGPTDDLRATSNRSRLVTRAAEVFANLLLVTASSIISLRLMI